MASCCVADTTLPDNVCINVPKIFDQCRLQICLTRNEIGAARNFNGTNDCSCSNGCTSNTVVPPPNAVSVTVSDFCTKSISIINKEQSMLRPCYWDVTVKFTFLYTLKFFNSDSCEISCVRATSTYTTTVTLFAGDDINTAVVNELYGSLNGNGPFAAVEASAISLNASLHYKCSAGRNDHCFICCPADCTVCAQDCGNHNGCGCSECGECNTCNGYNGRNGYNGYGNHHHNGNCASPYHMHSDDTEAPDSVNITIGLFAVVKLLRLSNISVETQGNCIPGECTNTAGASAFDPCAFFNSLEFPVDLFAPQTAYVPASQTTGNTSSSSGLCCC